MADVAPTQAHLLHVVGDGVLVAERLDNFFIGCCSTANMLFVIYKISEIRPVRNSNILLFTYI